MSKTQTLKQTTPEDRLVSDGPEAWTPRRTCEELERYVVAQDEAKRAVSVAIRNRWRRQQLTEEIRVEVLPKNIMMVGPTGVGKTEIARRVARFIDAPFIKVEASNFTEVGYVGRDVDSMIRDLVDAAISQIHQERLEHVQEEAESSANKRLAEILVEQKERDRQSDGAESSDNEEEQREDPAEQRKREANAKRRQTRQRNRLLGLLQQNEIDDEVIDLDYDIEIEAMVPQMGSLGQGNEDDLQEALSDLVDGFMQRKRSRKVKIREARTILTQQEAHRMIDFDAIMELAIERAEQTGIIFIDEIDKTISQSGDYGPDVSGEGVQRDLLPIVEGCVVMTRYGPVRTDHMLFIAAGAFHNGEPSDLIPELQGRFPVRVELQSLGPDELYRILTEPENALPRQYRDLLATEDVTLEFTEDGLREIASVAALVNERTENIGARRLHTLMERVLEALSFDAPERAGETIQIDAVFVRDRMSDIVLEEDSSKFIL
jgi:ATP-dependent HslUV protease ATP-binding subunit HslU